MNARPENIAEVRKWIEKAEHDLSNAEYVVTKKEDCPFDTVCFHCQQCIEKYLKAVLVLYGVPFPKTHDLRLLLDLIRLNTGVYLDPENILPLNRYTIEGRYPGDWEPITEEDADEALFMTRATREVARNCLPAETL
jgi:HEPN domain-containing protein